MIFFVDYLVVCHIDIISAITKRYTTRLDDFMWTLFVVEDILQRLTTASLNNSSTVEKKHILFSKIHPFKHFDIDSETRKKIKTLANV